MLTDADRAYRKIRKLAKEWAVYESIHATLVWDQETHMPEGAASIRAAQLEALAGLTHSRRCSASFKKALSALIDLDSGQILAKQLSDPQQAALREWRRQYIKDTALPNAFVRKYAKVTTEARQLWKLARAQNKFSLFKPHLQKIVDLCRKKADLLGYEDHPYDALLDLYEPYMTTKQLTPLFDRIRTGLVPLIRAIGERPQLHCPLKGHAFDVGKQMQLSQRVLDLMGYSWENGRIDLSTHPFCLGLHPTDTRITTRLDPYDLPSGIGAAMHEGGHALYEMHLPLEEHGTPLCESRSLGIHESQSRLWETRVGQSRPFCDKLIKLVQELFPEESEGITADDLYVSMNRVEPSFIRVEADEVTYPLHVILRFDIERALIEGSLKVSEVPEAWNALMQESLGITPSCDAEGCLQDIHWSLGALGYFPTYLLGSMYATQIFEAYRAEHPNWKEQLSQGELNPLSEWLTHRIHQMGKQLTPQDLLKHATGHLPSEVPYLEYLKDKYSRLYQLDEKKLQVCETAYR